MKFILVFLILKPFLISADNSLFYCASLDCTEPISFGKTLLVYHGKTDKHLSFSKNEDIKVLSKPLGGVGDDWVAEYRGKVGLVPQSMVREQRMSKYDIKYKFPFNELPLPSYAPNVEESDSSSSLQEIDSPDVNNSNEEIKIDSPPPEPQNSSDAQQEQEQPSQQQQQNTSEVVVEQTGSPSFEILVEPPGKSPPSEVENNSVDPPPIEQSPEKEALNPDPISDPVPPPKESVETLSVESKTTSEELPHHHHHDHQIDEGLVLDAIETEDKQASPHVHSDQQPQQQQQQVKNNQSQESPGSSIPEPIQETIILIEPTIEENTPVAASVESVDTISPVDSGNSSDESFFPSLDWSFSSSSSVESSSESPPSQEETKSEEILSAEVVTPEPQQQENLQSIESQEEEEQNLSSVPSIEQPPVVIEPIPVVDPLVKENLENQVPEVTPTPHEQQQQQEVEQKQEEQTIVDTLIASEPKEKEETKEPLPTVPSVVDPVPEVPSVVDSVPEVPSVVDAVPEVPLSTNDNVESVTEETPPEQQQQSESSNVDVPLDPIVPIPAEPVVQDIPETTLPTEESQSDQDKKETLPVDPIVTNEEQQQQQQEKEQVSTETTPTDVNVVVEPEPEVLPPETIVVAELPSTETETTEEQPSVPSADTTTGPIVPDNSDLPVESATEFPPSQTVDESLNLEIPSVEKQVEQEKVVDSLPTSDSSQEFHHHHDEHSEDHHHHHHHHHHKNHEEMFNSSSTSPLVIVLRHLSATLMSFLPEALQDSILDVNDAQILTGIIALTLISICVPYFLIETVLSMRPLKKQVEELSNSLWKSKTAYEIQLEEFEVYKKKALAHDAKQKRIEQLENELLVANKLLSKQKEQIKILQKELKVTSKAAMNFESIMDSTRKKKDETISERDSLLVGIQNLQEALKVNVAELEDSRSEARLIKEQCEQASHEKDTLSKLLKKAETTIEMVKTKTANEHELRRQAEKINGQLRLDMTKIQEEMKSVKDICEQYEKTASALSEEVTSKENELLALKETLGEDSPLIEIAEAKARSATAEEEAATLRKRVESMSIEISSLSRNYEETKSELTTIKEEKEQAENRLQVLETWFKKQEDELRATVEKYETERNIRGKDESELIKMIHDKDDEISQLKGAKEALKQEIEEIKATDKAEIRKLEARIGDNFLQMCQSERKINEARKEAELLRQKLAAVARQGEENGGGDLYGDINPLPPLPDDLPMSMPMPSYFGMDDMLDPLPPLPLDGNEPVRRPAPLGRMSPPTPPYIGYPGDDPTSPIAPPPHGARDYSNYSSGSNSPIDMRPGSRDDWINDRTDRPRSIRNHRGPIPTLSSSPIPHGVNL